MFSYWLVTGVAQPAGREPLGAPPPWAGGLEISPILRRIKQAGSWMEGPRLAGLSPLARTRHAAKPGTKPATNLQLT